MEDVLRFAIPALDVPARWFNTTRTVNRNLRRGLYSNIVLNSTEQCDIQTKHTFIGHECQSFNIDQTTLICTVPSPRSDIFISIGAFHELCIYKNKHSYSWKDVSSWAKAFVPPEMKMKCTPDRMKYMFQKINKFYQSYSKNRKTEDLKLKFKALKHLQFFKFMNETVPTPTSTVTSDVKSKNKQLSKMCVKLINQQRQNILETEVISEENRILREQLQHKNLVN